MNTQLIGILNVTPDSFSDGGLYFSPAAALAHAEEMFQQGASIVDVGAESTRPKATALTAEEEWQRLEPVLPALLAKFPGRISLDTYHPETVERASTFGKFYVNDVTTFVNPAMIAVAAKYHLPVMVSHLPLKFHGNIQAAHQGEPLTDSSQVRDELLSQKQKLLAAGIKPEDIILDPGIGFGKTMPLNWQLLEFARLVPDENVMIGHSRKRYLGEHRMDTEPNIRAAEIAITHGAAYLRAHDIAAHSRLLQSL